MNRPLTSEAIQEHLDIVKLDQNLQPSRNWDERLCNTALSLMGGKAEDKLDLTFKAEDIRAGMKVALGINEYRVGYMNNPKIMCIVATTDFWIQRIGSKADLANHLNGYGYIISA